tara:strand:- start:584 stop:763 length:180 start_codon:yes stop_codon:yes gene_type:complete
MMIVFWFKRSVYGNTNLYIAGEAKQHIEQLTGKKTVNKQDLQSLEAMGLNVEEITDEHL